jgi:DNA modification methylase
VSYYTDPLVTLLHGDCIEVMAELEADSVDAVVTDPPYGLEFMGKEWDSFSTSGAGFSKPGIGDRPTKWVSSSAGQVIGTPNRTCATCGGRERGKKKCGCEQPEWKPTGPPRSSEDRRVGDGWLGRTNLSQMLRFQYWCIEWGREALRVTKPGGYLLAFGGTRTHHRLVCALEDAGWIIRDELDWIYASGFPKGKANLKPAHEPIVLARKPGPLRPLGIDASRIDTTDTISLHGRKATENGWDPRWSNAQDPMQTEGQKLGRWPSNVLLSDPDLFDQPNPYVVGSGATSDGAVSNSATGASFWGSGGVGVELRPGYGDSGGYSRFFIIPKADRAERERGLAEAEKRHRGVTNLNAVMPGEYDEGKAPPVRANVHPTVKPIDLMRHLVRLVTPPGGVVLDPFLGSGTTCLAASEEGFRSIGVERELEYLEIAKGRLMATPMGLGLDHGLAGKAPPKTHPDLSKHQPKRRAAGENYSGGWVGTDEEPAA